MADYDLISLFHNSLTLLSQAIMDYVSVTFAFLIAGYFIADKLKSSMVVLIVFLFTSIQIGQLFNMYFLQHDMGVLTTEMALRAANTSFMLPNLVMTNNPGIYYVIVMGVAIIGCYIGALIFFFHQRRLGLANN